MEPNSDSHRPTVAVLGASRERAKFGNQSVRAHQQHGYEVFPINPFADEIEGLRAYHSLDELPIKSLDRISVYLPPEIVLSLLSQIAAKHPREVWLNPGSESPEVLRKAEEIGLNVIMACSIIDAKTASQSRRD